jgi:ATP synthase protein I
MDEERGSRGSLGGGSFEDRLKAARSRQGLDAPPHQAAAPGAAGPSPWGVGLRVGVEMVAALAVAVVIGLLLDRWLHTRPWLLMLFVLLGGAAGVLNVWRMFAPAPARRPRT